MTAHRSGHRGCRKPPDRWGVLAVISGTLLVTLLLAAAAWQVIG